MNNAKRLLHLLIACLGVLGMYSLSLSADSFTDMSAQDYEKVSYGGLLYDNWYSVLGLKTEGDHPSYPDDGKQKGGSTWRCKECHGWDYEGNKGAYASGSHFTGITGIRNSAGKDPEVITAILKNDTHSFGALIPEKAYDALAYFVAYGLLDMERYIDRQSGKAAGNNSNGARIYASTCAKCHGSDGKEINFKTPEKPEYIGTIANKNPWETLHKIRFGQPGTEMVNLLFLNISDQVDVVSYCQSLPVK